MQSKYSEYMSLQKKPPSPAEVSYKKPRRSGCCKVSVGLIAIVFLVACTVTLAYVFIFTDLIKHISGEKSSANSTEESKRLNEAAINATSSGGNSGLVAEVPPVVKLKDLNILVLIIDTTAINSNEGGAYKATMEAWKRAEIVWREMKATTGKNDSLIVEACRGCNAEAVLQKENSTVIFWSVSQIKAYTRFHSHILFVALPTPPGDILAVLNRYARTDSLGDICSKGSWQNTGCDFHVPLSNSTMMQFASFSTKPVGSSEKELLSDSDSKTFVIQKTVDTFKVLINEPSAV